MTNCRKKKKTFCFVKAIGSKAGKYKCYFDFKSKSNGNSLV